MKTLCIAIFMLLTATVARAQYTIEGKLSNQNQPVPYATVQLLAASDSSVLNYAFTDTAGVFTIKTATAGTYILSVNAMGFIPYKQTVNVSANINVGELKLAPATSTLAEVTVAYSKPLVEQQQGKTTINVASSIMAAGNSAYEVLGQSPGVAIDQNGAISLNGRQGVQVMVDGKLQPVSGDDLAALLKSIPANMIDRVELVRDPSAKYDAAGKGGIIDIRTKKNSRPGTSAGITSSYMQGRYGRINAGLNVSHQKGNWNFTGTYNILKRNDFNSLDINRSFLQNGQLTGTSVQDNYIRGEALIQTGQLIADYKLSPKTTLGAVGSIYLNNNTRYLGNNSTITNSTLVYTQTNGDSKYERVNPALNINLRQKLNDKGQLLTVDADIARYVTNNTQNNVTTTFNVARSQVGSPYVQYGDLDGALTIKTAKADYTLPLKGFFNKLEAGVKVSGVYSENNVLFYDRSNGGNVLLNNLSDHFVYSEKINSAYLSAAGETDKWNYQAGLRLEGTNIQGKQTGSNTGVYRAFDQLFPSLSAGYKVNEVHQLDLSLSRRIDRPGYRQLTPFRYYISESTYQVGNPNLQPQLSYNLELTHTISQKYSLAYSYSRTSNYMLSVLIPDEDKAGVVKETTLNLATLNYFGLNASAPFEAGTWFKSFNNLTIFYNTFKGQLVGTRINAGKVSWQFSTSNTFALSPTLSAELTGQYFSGIVDGFLTEQPRGALGAGIQKQLWNKKASIKLAATDILRTNFSRGYTETVSYQERYRQYLDSRLVSLTFAYRFGGAASGNKQKRSGADDEKQRAN